MSVFNNITYTLTDAEKFALICGMLLGLRLQDKTQPPQTVEEMTQPVSLSEDTTIGLKVQSIATDGRTGVEFSISVHDVNIGYSGFTLSLSFPPNLMQVRGVYAGTFGHLDDYNIDNESGEIYAYGLAPAGTTYSQPMTVLKVIADLDFSTNWLNIPLTLNNGNGYDTDYCTLLRYEESNLFFITPLSNINGKIINNRGGYTDEAMPTEEMTQRLLPALQDSGRGATASPSLIALGTAVIGDNSTNYGVMPIYLNSTEDGGFTYNKFYLKVKIREEDLQDVSFLRAVGIDGWGFTTSITFDEQGNQYLEIEGTRQDELIGNNTAGYIKFRTSTNSNSINVVVHNLESQLINTATGDTLDVLKGDGRVCMTNTLYITPSDTSSESDTTGWGSGVGSGTIATVPSGQTPTEADTNTAQQMQGSTGGGTEMTGQIYTDTEQIIEIDMGDGNKSFVYLEPGWNDIHVIIPTISGRTKWTSNITPKVKSSGYVLIPVGFKFRTFNNKAVKPGLSSPHLFDKLTIQDIYDIIKIEKPQNLEVEEFDIQDFTALTKIEIQKKAAELIDEFEIEDDYEITVERPVVPITADAIVDEFNLEDFTASTKQEIRKRAQDLVENYGIDEVFDVLVERPPVPVTVDTIREEVEVQDLTNTSTQRVTISNKNDREEVEVQDLTNTSTQRVTISNKNDREESQIQDFIAIEI